MRKGDGNQTFWLMWYQKVEHWITLKLEGGCGPFAVGAQASLSVLETKNWNILGAQASLSVLETKNWNIYLWKSRQYPPPPPPPPIVGLIVESTYEHVLSWFSLLGHKEVWLVLWSWQRAHINRVSLSSFQTMGQGLGWGGVTMSTVSVYGRLYRAVNHLGPRNWDEISCSLLFYLLGYLPWSQSNILTF